MMPGVIGRYRATVSHSKVPLHLFDHFNAINSDNIPLAVEVNMDSIKFCNVIFDKYEECFCDTRRNTAGLLNYWSR